MNDQDDPGPSGGAAPAATSGFEQSLSTLLPMNRKERFFTGTVLPGIVASDELSVLPTFLRLCGLPIDTIDEAERSRVQFWTEYGFAESLFTDDDRARFDDAQTPRDTPDVVIVGADWLVAVEAKMYDKPSLASLQTQLTRQGDLVAYWTDRLGFDRERVKQVLLLPEAYARELGPVEDVPTVTWEAVAEAHAGLASTYWLTVLWAALDHYDDLASRSIQSFGTNATDQLTGAEIIEQYRSGRHTVDYVGRGGGPYGQRFESDLSTGGWRTQLYEVRSEPLTARNWFPVRLFVDRVQRHVDA